MMRRAAYRERASEVLSRAPERARAVDRAAVCGEHDLDRPVKQPRKAVRGLLARHPHA